MATAPTQILAPSYSARVAKDIMDGAETWIVGIGGAWGLDLTNHSCELCGGFFPTKGDAAMYLDANGSPLYCHSGCVTRAEDWTEDE